MKWVGNSSIRVNKEVKKWLGVWMDAHLTFEEHHDRCMKTAGAAEAWLLSLTGPHGVIAACGKVAQTSSIEDVALYRSGVWWDPKKGSQWEDIQLLLNRPGRSTLSALPPTLNGALMRNSGLTPAAVALDTRPAWFLQHWASTGVGSKLKMLFNYPTRGAQVGRVAAIEHTCCRIAETLCWPDPGVEPEVKTTILEDGATAMRATKLWATRQDSKAGSGKRMWWTDGFRTDDGRVGATAVCLNGDGWTVFWSYLSKGWMAVFHSEQWVTGVALRVSGATVKVLRARGVTTVVMFSDSPVAIW